MSGIPRPLELLDDDFDGNDEFLSCLATEVEHTGLIESDSDRVVSLWGPHVRSPVPPVVPGSPYYVRCQPRKRIWFAPKVIPWVSREPGGFAGATAILREIAKIIGCGFYEIEQHLSASETDDNSDRRLTSLRNALGIYGTSINILDAVRDAIKKDH